MVRRTTSTDKLEVLEAVINETRSLFHRLKVVANELHAEDNITAGKRGVLLDLHRSGPQTVPHLARARPVSRQHIQSLVNPLFEAGYVEFVENPIHRGSPLVRLTNHGGDLIQRILRREAPPLIRAAARVTKNDLEKTLDALRAINAYFDSGEWKQFTAASAGKENAK
jgi:DNA-binding MarR family transcriptional regulator